MTSDSQKKQFADLLANGIAEIQRHESAEDKKLIREIHKELGAHIGRQETTIRYFLRGYIPSSFAELEELALEVARRGRLDKGWLEQILILGQHPNPSRVWARAEQHEIVRSKKRSKPAIHINSPSTVSELRALSDQQRHDILEARAVDALAITMWRLLPAFQDEFLTVLRRGGVLRFLLVHYQSAAIRMAAFRSDSQTSAETQAYRVKENLKLLAKWKQNIPNANIQVKLIDYLPAYGITVIYPIDSGISPNCLVRLNPFKSPTSLAPSITPDPLKDKYWFDFFCEQFRLMWEAGVEFNLSASNFTDWIQG